MGRPCGHAQGVGDDGGKIAHQHAAIQQSLYRQSGGLDQEGFVVEGAYSALLWWRGDTLCAPPLEFDRVDSVTARTVLAVATALGVEVLREAVTPAELDGLEIWSLNALHGIRIVTRWIDGPEPAEQPGRLRAWRARLGKLSRPLDTVER